MAIIALKGIRMYGYHGFYEEEQIMGNDFILDVAVDTAIAEAAKEDDLYKSVNYETIHLICKIEMREPVKLLETLAKKIHDRLADQFAVSGVSVTITKLNPPLGGIVASASVQESSGTLQPGGASAAPSSPPPSAGGGGGFGGSDFSYDDDDGFDF